MLPGADRRDAGEWPPLETRVRADEAVAAACPHCGRPFATREARDLHVGDRHADACSTAEREAYEAARDDEREVLFYFHLRVVAALGVLYAVTVLLYMIALGGGVL
jgi:hypothetical protein